MYVDVDGVSCVSVLIVMDVLAEELPKRLYFASRAMLF
jgi:hypothetical protein